MTALHNKDNTYYRLAGNSYDTKNSVKIRLKILMALLKILKFKLRALIKRMDFKRWLYRL